MVMAEAVHIGTDGTQLPETIQQIPLGIQPLPDKSLSTGKDAVRLQEPASCNFPSSLRHTLPDLLKHFRKDSLYPFKNSVEVEVNLKSSNSFIRSRADA